MQQTQSIMDLEIEDWRSSTTVVHPTAPTAHYYEEVSYGNGTQHYESPLSSPPMIHMSSPHMANAFHKQQYGNGQPHMHLASIHHSQSSQNHHQQHYDAIPMQQHAQNGSQNQYDMEMDSVYQNTYGHIHGQQQIRSPPFSSHHAQRVVDQQQTEPSAVCDPRFVSGHQEYISPTQRHATVTSHAQQASNSSSGSVPSSPTTFDQTTQVKIEGDNEDYSNSAFSPLQPPQPLTVVIPPPNSAFNHIRSPISKRKSSSASDSSGIFDPGYSLTNVVRLHEDGVLSPTSLISPLERTDLDRPHSQDLEGEQDGSSDADGDSEEYDYEDPNDSEFILRSRHSVPRRTSYQQLSTPPQTSDQQWLDVPIGRRRAATSPNVALPPYQPQPSYPWGFSQASNASFNSNAGGFIRSRSGTTSVADYGHRYNPYPSAAGYQANGSYDQPQSIAHSNSFDSSATSGSYADELQYPSLHLSLHSLRGRRSSISTATSASTTTPNTPLTPLTPLSSGGDVGISQPGSVHIHGYATRSGGVSHSYSSSSAYEGGSNNMANEAHGHMGIGNDDGLSSSNKRRSRPSASLPVPVPIPNLTKKSRGRRVPTIYSSAASANKGARVHMCKVPGCGKCFARGEHLKRHVRSIHTWEKPHKCPYPGCGKDFSRHDNLGQHMRVHKDYNPRT